MPACVCDHKTMENCTGQYRSIEQTVMRECTEQYVHIANFICWKPSCIKKKNKLDELEVILAPDPRATATVAPPFQTAKTIYELNKAITKDPDFLSSMKLYMRLEDFNKWGLVNPPGLVSQFFIKHPTVILEAMIHWILNCICM